MSDDNLSPNAAELARLARKTLGHMSDAQHARGLEAVRGHGARRRSERRRKLLAIGGVTAATAMTAFLLAPRVLQRLQQGQWQWNEGAPPLTLKVEAGAIDGAGAIVARDDEQAALRFGDGTVIRLGSETRGRLAGVDGNGAHVAIENGSAHVSVVHKPHARWLIDAGPYQITVHGTVFSASWDESQQRLDVKMERGLVSVAGPVTNGPIAVRAGQALTVKLKRSQVLLRDLDRDDVVADVDADADREEDLLGPPAAVAPPAPPARAHVAVAVGNRGARPLRVKSWTAALSAGDFDAILDDAERDIGHVLATRGTEDLAALADAARYRRHDDVARRALLAQRRRFAGSPRAADAAFFLGRLDENGGRGHGPALAWYERYLDEAPRGSYAAEALGRKMIAVEELHGAAAARNVAEQYIRRFPRGSYAGAARALLGAR